jgi:outer membrane lipoprotein SlyB
MRVARFFSGFVVVLASCAGPAKPVVTSTTMPTAGTILAVRPVTGQIDVARIAPVSLAAPASDTSPHKTATDVVEFIVRQDDGHVISIVQENDGHFAVGDPIKVIRDTRSHIVRAS